LCSEPGTAIIYRVNACTVISEGDLINNMAVAAYISSRYIKSHAVSSGYDTNSKVFRWTITRDIKIDLFALSAETNDAPKIMAKIKSEVLSNFIGLMDKI
jgi:hypothetical protein